MIEDAPIRGDGRGRRFPPEKLIADPQANSLSRKFTVL
jgi:hypothetical protein